MAICLHCGSQIQVFTRDNGNLDKMMDKKIKCPSCGLVTQFKIENKNINRVFEKGIAKLNSKIRDARH